MWVADGEQELVNVWILLICYVYHYLAGVNHTRLLVGGAGSVCMLSRCAVCCVIANMHRCMRLGEKLQTCNASRAHKRGLEKNFWQCPCPFLVPKHSIRAGIHSVCMSAYMMQFVVISHTFVIIPCHGHVVTEYLHTYCWYQLMAQIQGSRLMPIMCSSHATCVQMSICSRTWHILVAQRPTASPSQR